MTNKEKAKSLADQCKPCTDDFYSGFYQGALIALNAETVNSSIIDKAAKYDELEEEIAKYYEVDEAGNFIDEEADLATIGEVVSMKLGFI